MKKNILITGANSYVGTNVEKWLMKEQDKYYIETLDLKDPNWKDFDFSKFDVVFHVAGIAHIKEKKTNKDFYNLVNRDLAIEVAKKSKINKVRHFIFMSSMSVFGNVVGVITNETKMNPISFYGKSKLEAEQGIFDLIDNDFNVTILRPPMIYGRNSPGNYQKLSKLSKSLRFFPNLENRRSILYIDNLSIAIENIIRNKQYGVINPSNTSDINTYDLVRTIRSCYNKKTNNFILLIPIIKFAFRFIAPISKVFSSLYYDDNLKYSLKNYIDFHHSIVQTEDVNI